MSYMHYGLKEKIKKNVKNHSDPENLFMNIIQNKRKIDYVLVN